ncbi:hypothetical protein L1987_13760 [Smallanthus sonchifolius]|uniref:Uncharacterized protein n=1 Tax=Smallanthus sonchifolius TaxID=185202 RepID=A0ACB9JHU0_9ASTR|nr:hypothetical protein L1987_13760 [Smallanthus sonchifolius]
MRRGTCPSTSSTQLPLLLVDTRKFPVLEDHNDAVSEDPKPKSLVIHFYTRSHSRKRTGSFHGCSSYDTFLAHLKAVFLVQVKVEDVEFVVNDVRVLVNDSNKKRNTSQKLVNLGLDLVCVDTPRAQVCSSNFKIYLPNFN